MLRFKRETKSDGISVETIDTDSIDELYYICDIKNLRSILEHGILSHHRVAKKVSGHTDISNGDVQENRSRKRIERPEEGKKPMSLHRHTPLYLNPHNGMMHSLTYNKGDKHTTLCVLRINKAILERRNAILTDKNAACSSVSFFTPEAFTLESPASEYLTLPYGYVKEEDSSERDERKQTRQAEALIPYEVQKEYICGIFVSSAAGEAAVKAELTLAGWDCEVTIHASMFFQGKNGWPPRLSEFKIDTTMRGACPPSPESSSSEGESTEEYILPIKRQCSQAPRAAVSSPVRSVESEITSPSFFAMQTPCLEALPVSSSSSPTRLSEVNVDNVAQEVKSTSSPEPENDSEHMNRVTMGGVGLTC